MKPTHYLPAVLALCCVLPAPRVPAENIIRQTLLDSGLTYDLITNNDTGSGVSFLPIGPGGASYELFARGSAWDTNLYFLDRKVVGSYLPKATVRVWTGDSFSETIHGTPTTRADQPFILSVTVSGLDTDPSAPPHLQSVLYTHVGQDFTSNYIPEGNPEYTITSSSLGNGNSTFDPLYTSLSGPDPTKVKGLERFTVSSVADGSNPSSILSEVSLYVWPVSEAAVTGVTPATVVRDDLPQIQINYADLYPVSMTYAQVYAGPESLGTVGTVIGGSVRWHFTSVPQNELITLDNWEYVIPEDGEYTLEVLTMTPFGDWAIERMAHVTFNVNRKISIRGSVTTME